MPSDLDGRVSHPAKAKRAGLSGKAESRFLEETGILGMAFEEFVARRVVQQKGYTWEVERDAMDWETAVGGIKTMRRKLQELRESERVQQG